MGKRKSDAIDGSLTPAQIALEVAQYSVNPLALGQLLRLPACVNAWQLGHRLADAHQ
jgi:hypothetical protein